MILALDQQCKYDVGHANTCARTRLRCAPAPAETAPRAQPARPGQARASPRSDGHSTRGRDQYATPEYRPRARPRARGQAARVDHRWLDPPACLLLYRATGEYHIRHMAISIEAPAGVKYFIGIVRVSEVGKRDPSRLRSPTEQRESIVREATRLGGEVATVKEEI